MPRLTLTALLFTLLCLTAPAYADVLPAKQAQTYRQARDLVDSNPQRALELAGKLDAFEHVDEHRLELIAAAALNAGQIGRAIEALAKLGEVAERPIDQLHAHVERGELLLLQGKLDACAEAIEAARKAARTVSGDSADERWFEARRWRLVHDLAIVRSDAATPKAALKAAEELLTGYPAEDAAQRAGLVMSPADLSVSQRFERARSLYDSWAYRAARRAFQELLDEPKYEARARWYLAHLALNKLRDRPKEAEEAFAKLAAEGPYREESLYQVARAQMRQERYDDALATLDTYLKRYPRGRHVGSVFYYRGWLPYDHRENDEAIAGFKQYIKRYGKGSGRSSYIYGFLAWTYMREGEWQNAIDTYEEMKVFGNMLVWGKALYWQAHAYKELGQKKNALAKLDELRDRYAVTYYGVLGEQLRAKIEGKDARASKVWWPEGAGKLADAPDTPAPKWKLSGLSKRDEQRWQRVQALVQLGEHHLARQAIEPIYGTLLRAVPAKKRNAWIHALGHYVRDFHHMWEVSTGGTIAAMPSPPAPNSRAAKMAYPRAYKDVVESVAAEFELPPELMWGVMRQESRFRPAQISYTDAVGALQMIPKTARKVARDLDIVYNPRTFPIPEVGFRYSGYYMRKLIDTFDGLLVPTAAAYNSGPQIVAYWFRQNPDASFPWLIEEFAYNEGRNYCRKVAEHMVRYLYLYEADPKRRGELLDKIFPTSRDIELPEQVGY